MKHTPENTADILEAQGEALNYCAALLRDGKKDQEAMRYLIFAQAVIAQELANIADNWEE